MADRKTELLIWLMENHIEKVECRQIMTSEDTSRTEVTFYSDCGKKKTVSSWSGLPTRNQYESHTMALNFRPGYYGLFDVQDHEAKRVLKVREEKKDLIEARDKLKAQLKGIEEQLGGA